MIAEICLALVIYFEARGEPIDGKLAVVDVVLNRVEDKRWPDTICKVMKQPKQFSFYKEVLIVKDDKSFEQAKTIARHVSKGYRPNIIKANHYHTTDIEPKWSKKLKHIRTIGKHIFYMH